MKRVLIALVVLLAAVGSVGWYKYYTYKKSAEYQIGKAAFIEDFRLASGKYTPATVVGTDGNKLTYSIPKQVIRNGQIYVDSEISSTLITDATQFYTNASTSLGLTAYTIPAGTPIRILVAPIFEGSASTQAVTIYSNQDVIYPPVQ